MSTAPMGMFKGGGHASIPPSITGSLTDTDADSTNQTTYALGSQSIGAAAEDRIVVLAINAFWTGGSGRTISSVSIGGSISASPAGSLRNNGNMYAAIYRAAVPTSLIPGTTATVSITWSGAMNGCAISVYRMVGANPTPSDTGGEAATDPEDTLSVVKDGFGVGCSTDGDSGNSATWTGLSTKDTDAASLGAVRISTAHGSFASTGSQLIKCNWASTATDVGAFAAWQPAL